MVGGRARKKKRGGRCPDAYAPFCGVQTSGFKLQKTGSGCAACKPMMSTQSKVVIYPKTIGNAPVGYAGKPASQGYIYEGLRFPR
jgi:hypothetical protein